VSTASRRPSEIIMSLVYLKRALLEPGSGAAQIDV
jgi:hypothetical protein